MPMYDFQCKACQHNFELMLSLAERNQESEKKICPKCSSKEVGQVLSSGSGYLKGGLTHSANSSGCASGCCGGGTCGF